MAGGRCIKEDAVPVHQTLLKDKRTFKQWDFIGGQGFEGVGAEQMVKEGQSCTISLLEWEGEAVREVSLWDTPQE